MVWFGRFLSKEGLIDCPCQKRGLFLASLSVHQRRNGAGVKLRGGQRDDSAICVGTCRDLYRYLYRFVQMLVEIFADTSRDLCRYL